MLDILLTFPLIHQNLIEVFTKIRNFHHFVVTLWTQYEIRDIVIMEL